MMNDISKEETKVRELALRVVEILRTECTQAWEVVYVLTYALAIFTAAGADSEEQATEQVDVLLKTTRQMLSDFLRERAHRLM